MKKDEILKREKWLELNQQINQQLRAAGVMNHTGKIVKPFDTLPESEWKQWMKEKINLRNSYQ